MADGSHKPIEKIKPGDKVAATDPATGRTTARTVVAKLASTGVKHLVQVTITTGPAGHTHTGTVTSTDIHPFWVTDPHPHQGPNLANGHWTYAEDLHPGDHLRTTDNQPAVVTTTLTYTLTNQTVHNLTVDADHTYYVLTAPTPVLVHNSGGECDVTGRRLWQLTKEGSSKIMKGGPFKTTFYKSASDGTWWTRDVTGHGKSAFKVYRETSQGFEWISDADKFGTYITEKWKGDTGRFIPKDSLRGVKG